MRRKWDGVLRHCGWWSSSFFCTKRFQIYIKSEVAPVTPLGFPMRFYLYASPPQTEFLSPVLQGNPVWGGRGGRLIRVHPSYSLGDSERWKKENRKKNPTNSASCHPVRRPNQKANVFCKIQKGSAVGVVQEDLFFGEPSFLDESFAQIDKGGLCSLFQALTDRCTDLSFLFGGG
mmetsp:Transcript_18753/g.47464  ORF Transcript_18753/g.47464 Transcript_18753/m.47464 type:complete len:175 (-) Transcript_18753:2551-3075(-)